MKNKSCITGVGEDEFIDVVLSDLEITIFIGSNNTFAFVNMFEDAELRDAVMLLWEDGCLDFGDKRGLYKAKLEVEAGLECGELAFYFSELNRID